jgi:hypothetical protein
MRAASVDWAKRDPIAKHASAIEKTIFFILKKLSEKVY